MKNKIIIITLGVALTLSSCKDVLDTEPRQSISAQGALSSITGVKGLLTNVYDNIQASGLYGRDVIIQSEVLSDNCRITTVNSNRFILEYNNTLRTGHFDDFAAIYPIINKCNLVIDNVDKTTDGTPTQVASVKGQALFLRAWMYFTLANEYAYNPKHIQGGFDLGVPLMLEGVSGLSQVTYPKRAKIGEVYTQIKNDLDVAISILDNTGGKILAGKAAAQALRSRVSLYNEEWQSAIDNATLAINSNLATFVTTPTVAGYASIFNQKISPESLFELNYEVTESLGTTSIQNIYQRLGNSATSSSGYGDVVPQNNLLAAYEANDVRKAATLLAVNKGGEPVFWVQKYAGSSGTFSVDNIRIIRISEMYLNRAEAYARLGGQDGLAQADVNKIRNRAGLPSTLATGAALLDVILKERRIELAYEGDRWFDLIRRGADIVKDNGTLTFATDIRILAPIPQAQLDINNPNLVKNPGY
ncbi:RagB/SusD family nutrient uptake outer membrane protein [Pedobacter sp. LMG 31464]|uniref:RagB/SusD family nutrient uptake outer membrane protein n=1 Tax=Pedobacter planticolens TaxID=2679964 RepID=A0A923IVP5_9SPHI|nr:RagB/SusD family nutrient uptake outer membrane protein [Pedobacter planticolens]MBB2146251.1 RagB/SusD family nutrient uptake outer membrane protein [Pedobacter planticolens]